MRKLPVAVIGLAFAIASCAPYAATIAPTEMPAPTDTLAEPIEALEPTATPEASEPTSTTEPQASSGEALTTPVPGARNFQPQLEQLSIDLNEVVTLLPPDAIRAVLPEDVPDIMVTAAEAEAAGIAPDVQVLGVEIGGESRAYPIPFLSAHEIVNDTLGGRHIAVTW